MGFGMMGACCCGSADPEYTVFCGITVAPTLSNIVDQYTINTWSTKTNGPTNPSQNPACASLSGASYITGGNASGTMLSDNYEYVTDVWTTKTSMPSPTRFRHAAFSIGSYCYFFYGVSGALTDIRDNDRYDPAGDSWSSMTDATSPARSHMAGAVAGSKGYSMCGLDPGFGRRCEEYDPSGDSWTTKTQSPTPARGALAGFGIGSMVYATGGADSGSTGLKDIDEFNPAGNSWTSKTDAPSKQRNHAGAAGASSGLGYSTGGIENGGSDPSLATNSEFDPGSNAWTSRAAASVARRDQCAGMA